MIDQHWWIPKQKKTVLKMIWIPLELFQSEFELRICQSDELTMLEVNAPSRRFQTSEWLEIRSRILDRTVLDSLNFRLKYFPEYKAGLGSRG